MDHELGTDEHGTVDCGAWKQDYGTGMGEPGWGTNDRGLKTKDRGWTGNLERSQMGLDLNYNYYLHAKVIYQLPLEYSDLLGQQGWHSVKIACLPPMWPGFNSGSVPYVG